MDVFQYDTPSGFCIRVEGALVDRDIDELEDAWMCANSVLNGRPIMVDLACVTSADQGGLALLKMLQASGTLLAASHPPVAPEIAALLGVSPAPGTTPPLPLFRRLWLAIQAR